MNILKFEKSPISKPYLTISILGIRHKLNIKYSSLSSVTLTKKDNEFILNIPKIYKTTDNTNLIKKAIQKLYSEIAVKEIEDSLELARHILKFAPEDYLIKRMDGSLYKTVNKKILIINPDIIQYSKEIINSTIIKELCKMQHRPNTKIYEKTIKDAMEKYEIYKKSPKETFNLVYKIS